MKAVRVLSKAESKKILNQCPDRVVSSRFKSHDLKKEASARVGAYKFKSRWRIHGHQDLTPEPLRYSGAITIFLKSPPTSFYQCAFWM